MTRPRHIVRLACLAGLSLLLGCAGSDHHRSDATGRAVPELACMDDATSRFIRRWDIPGASLAIARRGRLVYARGFGFADRAAHERVEPESRFRLASVSKTVTAVAIMKLVEQGRLALDQQVFGPGGILDAPEYSEILDERVHRITLQDLLQHSSGWDSSLGYDPQYDLLQIASTMGVPPPADGPTIIRYMLRHRRLDVEPGTEYHYSNFGYNILGRIIEKVSGTTYEAHVRSEILDPVGIAGMCIAGDLLRDRRVDEVYYHDMPDWPLAQSVYGTGERVPESYGGLHFKAMDAHGGWVATATDLMRYASALEGFSGHRRLLRAETLQTMTTVAPEMKAADSTYALGWVVYEDGRWGHSGALTTGTFTYLGRRPDGVQWALLCNRLPVDVGNVSGSLGDFMKDAEKTLLEGLAEVKTWPDHDWF